MASYTLDDIRAAADAKYASTDIDLGTGDVVHLINPLRLSKASRDKLHELQDQLEADNADQQVLLEDAIRLVSDNGQKADALLAAIGGDLAVLAQIFETYGASTQVGEASASAA
ncbi:phage tail assembly protein [Kitasatospora sp. NPDC048194]|uniref:phage tail assembly protein n=1 Tax=Kitasatospora sp. NPDC048194 TaxID=3364045 RepID=UPI003711B4A1